MDMPSSHISGDQDETATDDGSRGFFGKLGARMGRQRSEPVTANLHTRDALLLLRKKQPLNRATAVGTPSVSLYWLLRRLSTGLPCRIN